MHLAEHGCFGACHSVSRTREALVLDRQESLNAKVDVAQQAASLAAAPLGTALAVASATCQWLPQDQREGIVALNVHGAPYGGQFQVKHLLRQLPLIIERFAQTGLSE
ncbi:hypothetical protein D7X30_04235 [Corallococcus sp. AB011P]|nr:hypothetical protein D7X30_04235 [Corallococcus sp. AB011P]RKH91359.1 hypothetical protein D7Y21_03040 [Corallococcus sp. AB045]